jgi:putative addiction module killer protein
MGCAPVRPSCPSGAACLSVSTRIHWRLNTIQRTAEFDRWLGALRDGKAKARVLARIASAQHGNFGDCKAIGDGVREMRIDVGPGYRLYFMRRAETVYLLLAGGDKATQARDIRRAKTMVHELKERGTHRE